MTPMDRKILADIHRYWFGDLTPDGASPPKEKMQLWFRQSDATDADIRERFGQYLDGARDADWSLDSLTREEQVGLVVLLDQFPRNIFRVSADAFAYDAKARDVARALLQQGVERFLPIERQFLSLPFSHSETVADQDFAVAFTANEAVIADDADKERARVILDFASKHRDVVRKFGRFPHRNVMLSRESTAEETEFLKGGRGY
jgi:uncharacterized protein (DUF924 family)